jgi:hypothetical protein
VCPLAPGGYRSNYSIISRAILESHRQNTPWRWDFAFWAHFFQQKTVKPGKFEEKKFMNRQKAAIGIWKIIAGIFLVLFVLMPRGLGAG